jgi:hypothetical protein
VVATKLFTPMAATSGLIRPSKQKIKKNEYSFTISISVQQQKQHFIQMRSDVNVLPSKVGPHAEKLAGFRFESTAPTDITSNASAGTGIL